MIGVEIVQPPPEKTLKNKKLLWLSFSLEV